MRNLTLAIAAVLACAALPVLAQDAKTAPPVKAPQEGQAAPGANPPPAANPQSQPKAAAPREIPPGPPSRYAFNRVDGGFLRLDNQTGHIAFCSPQPVGWACQMVPEDRAALDKEIARLKDEVAGLRAEVAALREPPPRPPGDLTPAPPQPPTGALPPASAPPPPAAADKNEDSAKLREDLARARAAFESAWRRLVDIIVNLQRDMMRKG
jgi:hypothetical protein